jgi:hypothetical protein
MTLAVQMDIQSRSPGWRGCVLEQPKMSHLQRPNPNDTKLGRAMWRIPAPKLLRVQLSWHVHQDSRWFVTVHASSLRLWSLPQIKQARRARCRSRPSWGPTTQTWPRATCRFPTGARSGVTDSIIFYFTLSRSYFETHVRLVSTGWHMVTCNHRTGFVWK